MNFDLTEEQALLRDLVLRYGADHYDAVKRLAYIRQADGFSRDHWAMLADMGLLAFALPEDAGGLGGSDTDLITVAEIFGSYVAAEPILPCVIMGAGALQEAGTDAQKSELLPQLISGERFAALAVFEARSRFNVDAITTQAVVSSDGEATLSGSKQIVMGGSFATDLVVAAKDSADGVIRLFLVDASSEGLAFHNYRLTDGSVASNIDFNKVPARIMDGGASVLQTLLMNARLYICGELVGLMSMMSRETLDYLKTRKQFGQPLGSFQAIQHRMADCYAKAELSRSQLYRAAGQKLGTPERDAAIYGAKAYISQAALHIGEEAVQLHGGIGTTEELLVGQAFKRVFALVSLLGDVDAETNAYLALTRAAG